ncbi:TRAP transporter large permease subunit [Ferribacterium limneticum]|uniref:TRAP transporter large permease subunit n=1 Tax=Ferribacterium limneticum TaxID=76259 RepID=UPI001CFBFA84|nr:TRAP transporter large permease subunit [Ferribacterium limneticum]UCV18519.1 TRAP transporter large permease subunit [Ferribacterium limneticum]
MNPWRRLGEFDALIAGGALLVMLLVPLLEIVLRPLFGSGIDNAPVLVQHCGLLLAMFGALLAERGLHLSALGAGFTASTNPLVRNSAVVFGKASAAVLCGMLAQASWTFVTTEMEMPRDIAYGIAGWMFEIAMPVGFALLGLKLASRITPNLAGRVALALALPAAGYAFAQHFDGSSLPIWPFALWLTLILFCGAPIFAVLGGLALALFWSEGQPLASVPLSHYQITVNPSLPALPLFTLAGLLFARTGAAARLGEVFTAAFGSGVAGTAIAAAVLCSFFTAFTGGSGVTILALGGLLLPLLTKAGFPEQRGISLVTSASALGVLLAPSVPLIMYAIIARVPINTMFLAGVLPAVLMVACLLLVGGYLRRGGIATVNREKEPKTKSLGSALWVAKWELLAPVVAIGSLVSGIATPTESAALTAMYALLTQSIAHRELDWPHFRKTLVDCAEVIGGIMLILGMALGLTNYLVDAGIPDAAIEWVQSVLPNKFAFLIALNLFLLLAGALMEIYAAIVVLVPLLLPVALAYGIDPVHFGVIFLANIEMGFLCPPAGMNIYFASAMFAKPIRYVAAAVLPAVFAMFIGALIISALPFLATWLPQAFGVH